MKETLFIIFLFHFFWGFGQNNEVDTLFVENFDNSQFPPENWSVSSLNTEKTWLRLPFEKKPFSQIAPKSIASALCPWDFEEQDEWLISPPVNFSNIESLTLIFYAGFKPEWTDNATLSLHLLARNDTITLWQAGNNSENQNWDWHLIETELDEYIGEDFRMAWQYAGKQGDIVALDGIYLFDGYENTKTDILKFIVNKEYRHYDIDSIHHQIFIEIAQAEIPPLSPKIQISEGATISPESGETQQFIDGIPFEYTVTAANPEFSQKWQVIITPFDYGTDITSLTLVQQTDSATIDTINHKVSIEVAYKTDFSQLQPEISVSPGATIQIDPDEEPAQFEDGVPVKYIVTAKDPEIEPQTWKVIVNEQSVKNGTNIQSFALPEQTGNAIIDTIEHTVHIEVEYHANLDSLVPEITVSDEAVISPPSNSPQHFTDNEAFIYTVTASNPFVAPQQWQVFVSVRDYETDILAFNIPNQQGEAIIDTTNHEIAVEVTFDTQLDNIIPTINISPGATISPPSETLQSFEAGIPKTYLVTPADPNTVPQAWEVVVTPAVFSQYFDGDEFPPEGWILKTSNQEKTWLAGNSDKAPFGSIKTRNQFSALCPWSIEYQSEQLISPLISSQDLEELDLFFYALFNAKYTTEATLSFWIVENESDTTELWNNAALLHAPDSLAWQLIQLDLNTFAGKNFRLMWKYEGSYGDLSGIDEILLIGKRKAAGIDQFLYQNNINAFPNPAHDFVRLVNLPQGEIRLYESTGRLLMKKQNVESNQTLCLSELPCGIYFIRIVSKTKSFSLKIVKN